MKINWKKWLVLVMSSVWFMPVSCTSMTLVATQAISHFGAQHPERGDPVPAHFEVAVFDPKGRDFQIELLRGAASKPISALIPQLASGIKPTEFGEQRYQVLNRQPLHIEVINRDDDYTTYNEYGLDNGKIIPLYHRLLGPGHGFVALFLGLIFACAIRRIARTFKQELYPGVLS